MARRLQAWLVCGPLGHLCAGMADSMELLLRWQWSRLRGRRGR
jgi:hypothetical protein